MGAIVQGSVTMHLRCACRALPCMAACKSLGYMDFSECRSASACAGRLFGRRERPASGRHRAVIRSPSIRRPPGRRSMPASYAGEIARKGISGCCRHGTGAICSIPAAEPGAGGRALPQAAAEVRPKSFIYNLWPSLVRNSRIRTLADFDSGFACMDPTMAASRTPSKSNVSLCPDASTRLISSRCGRSMLRGLALTPAAAADLRTKRSADARI